MAARPCHEMVSIWRPLMHLPSPKRQPVSNPKKKALLCQVHGDTAQTGS